MKPKIAIIILLLITALSSLTTLMIVVNSERSVSEVVMNTTDIRESSEMVYDSSISTNIHPEKDYSSYDFPELEKRKDEAKARLKKLEEFREQKAINPSN
ncbi:hypothetical protein C0584_04335 [Candidatus Parcubacteria bacterium]|nr:MAG: hypothetical protein C0584_04335 [Candidatus Parcubacteria bacterium]